MARTRTELEQNTIDAALEEMEQWMKDNNDGCERVSENVWGDEEDGE